MKRRLKNKYINNKDIVTIGIEPGDEYVGGERTLRPVISTTGEDHQKNYPDRIDGTPINYKVKRKLKHASCGRDITGKCENRRDFKFVPGGVQIENSNGFLEDEWATSAYKAIDMETGKTYLQTISHIFDDCDPDGNNNDNVVYQHDQWVGDIAKGNSHDDWALFELADNADVSGFEEGVYWENKGERRPFFSFYTKSGIEDLMIDDACIWRQGMVTSSKGDIQEVQVSNRITLERDDCFYTDHAFESTAYAAPGDSGSPYFSKSDQDPDNLIDAIGMFFALGDFEGEYIDCAENYVYWDSYGIPCYRLSNRWDIEPDLVD